MSRACLWKKSMLEILVKSNGKLLRPTGVRVLDLGSAAVAIHSVSLSDWLIEEDPLWEGLLKVSATQVLTEHLSSSEHLSGSEAICISTFAHFTKFQAFPLRNDSGDAFRRWVVYRCVCWPVTRLLSVLVNRRIIQGRSQHELLRLISAVAMVTRWALIAKLKRFTSRALHKGHQSFKSLLCIYQIYFWYVSFAQNHSVFHTRDLLYN